MVSNSVWGLVQLCTVFTLHLCLLSLSFSRPDRTRPDVFSVWSMATWRRFMFTPSTSNVSRKSIVERMESQIRSLFLFLKQVLVFKSRKLRKHMIRRVLFLIELVRIHTRFIGNPTRSYKSKKKGVLNYFM